MVCGFVVDPLEQFHPKKDSTMLLMQQALLRGYRVWCCQQQDLCFLNGEIVSEVVEVTEVDWGQQPWYRGRAIGRQALKQCQLMMMRKDPPVDQAFIHTTQLLSLLEREGVAVVNRPQALRDYNEKLAILRFPDLIPCTVLTADPGELRHFLQQEHDIIVKPLDGMGGASIYRLRLDDPNITVILDAMTVAGTRLLMAQRYLPQIEDGDHRILIVDGKPLDFAVARLAQPGETRANLAAGGRAEVRPLSTRQRELALMVGELARRDGMMLVGLDVIGEYITEINVTSPTGMRELQQATGVNAAAEIFHALEREKNPMK